MAQADPHAGGQQPASYQDLYASMHDVLDGVYTTYLAPFGPESGDQPATLRDQVILAANDIPKVFVMLLADPTPRRIVFLHCPTRFASSLRGALPWDDRVFGFQGDLRQGNQINLVEWPATPFACSILVTVPVLDQMDASWMTAAGADAVGPYLVNDPETEQLRARFLCPVPQRPVCVLVRQLELYALLLLDRCHWTNPSGPGHTRLHCFSELGTSRIDLRTGQCGQRSHCPPCHGGRTSCPLSG
jgi:hypothetical protein